MPSTSGKQHREDLAWAAGVFCGEGSCTNHQLRRWIGIRVTVGQSTDSGECPEMLRRLQRIFGFGRLYRMGWKKQAHHKTIWQFYINGFQGAQAAIAMMWNWLTPEKQDQAAKALETFHAARRERSTRNKHHAFKVAIPA